MGGVLAARAGVNGALVVEQVVLVSPGQLAELLSGWVPLAS